MSFELSHRQPTAKGLLIGFTNVHEPQALQLVGQFRGALKV